MNRAALRMSVAGGTDVGRVREGNEDSYLTGDRVFAVADGMGGHQAGEVASALALEPLRELDGDEFPDADTALAALVAAVRRANDTVVARSQDDVELAGMGTTLTAALVYDGRLLAAHVGDSRAYLLRGDEPISQLTTDHTLVERLVQEGRLSRDEAAHHPQRNVITRAIGNEPRVDVDSLPPLELRPGDRVLLCSDGLTGPLADEEIQTLVEVTGGGQDAVDALIAAANEAGGPDNITVVLLDVLGGPDPEPGAAAGATAVVDAPADPDAPADADAPTAPVARPAGDPPERGEQAHQVRQIRTSPTSDQDDWASTMGRYGDRQGAARGKRSGRATRVLAGILGAVVLLALLAGGGWFLLSRAYFVGEYEGSVAVYRGLPETVAGIPLYWVVDDTISDVRVDALPAFRREDVTEGLSAGSLREARQVVEGLRAQVENAQQGTEGDGSSSPGTDPEPTPSLGT